MSELRVMHPIQGDATVTWDPASEAETKKVKAIFDELIKNNMGGVAHTAEGAVFTRTFDPHAEVIEVIPPLVGG